MLFLGEVEGLNFSGDWSNAWLFSEYTRIDYPFLGGGFKYLLFSPLLGEDSHFDEHIFQLG